MNIAVVVRQVPDLIEPLEIDAAGTALDWSAVSFILNESDDHALEQALLVKEAQGGQVTVVALDVGEVDNVLFTAAAKGADRIIKLAWEGDAPPSPRVAAALYAAAIAPLKPELVLVGVQAHDEWEGVLAPLLAAAMKLPYVGVIRGVQAAEPCAVTVCKEFPGAVMARMKVRLPAVLGMLAADQPPRYVPVSRIRGAMKSAAIEEQAVAAEEAGSAVQVKKMYPPPAAGRAEMLAGSETEVAARIVDILAEKGLLK